MAKKSSAPPALQNNPFVPPHVCHVNNLPPEILSHIFALGAADWETVDAVAEEDIHDDDDDDDYSDVESEDEDDDIPFQVLVSHICRKWRQVAIDTPALWSHLAFYPNQHPEGQHEWLSRTKGHPLRIEIDFSIDDNAVSEDEAAEIAKAMGPDTGRQTWREGAVTNPSTLGLARRIAQRAEDTEMANRARLADILDLIVPAVARWQHFELMVSDYALANLTLTRLAACNSAPLLESLALYHYEDCEDYERFHPEVYRQTNLLPFKGNAPKLTHVSLWGVHIDWSDRRLLTNLIDLELAYHAHDVRPPFHDFAEIVTSNPRLETLTLCCSGPMRPQNMTDELMAQWPMDPPLYLPSVQNLVLAFLEEEYALPLLKRLQVPHLTNLVLDLEVGDYTEFVHELCSPLPSENFHSADPRTRLSNLTHLKISGLPCSHTAIHELYRNVPHLHSLQLNMHHLDAAFATLISYPQKRLRRVGNDERVDHLDPDQADVDDFPAVARAENMRTYDLVGPILHDAESGFGEPVQVVHTNTTIAYDHYCPSLHTLTISGLNGTLIKRLVETREQFDGFEKLKKLFLDEEDDVPEEDLEWLKGHVDEVEFFENSDDDEEEEDEDMDMTMDLDDIDEYGEEAMEGDQSWDQEVD